MVTRVGVEPAARAKSSEPSEISTEAFGPASVLGLTDEPDAVACVKYHALELSRWSARGVDPESETSPGCGLPPRWISDGTAVCGIPNRVEQGDAPRMARS